MTNKKTVLCLVAHPDDAELQCAGTLALLAKKGWKIVIATMTPGQAGSTELGAEEISFIRRIEAKNSVALLGGTYECLECEDLFIAYDKPTLLKVIALLRVEMPTIVIAPSPIDYIIDHEVTSKLAQTACIGANIPNIVIDKTSPIPHIPYLYYCDPIQGKDIFGSEVKSKILVDITLTIKVKEEMLGCHKSQREWLLNISKVDECLKMMKDYSKNKGKPIDCEFAEGFRQHLGFSYPTENILESELGELVHIMKECKIEIP